jgi:hypothetical protein
VGASGHGGGVVTAGEVADAGRRPGLAGVPPVAPVHQGEQHRVEFLAFFCGAVVLAGRPLLVPLADEDILLDQPGQPGREDLAGNPEIMGEVIKPGDPGQITDEEIPPIVGFVLAPHGRPVVTYLGYARKERG